MVTALLDACVLYPAPLRDFLLNLACSGIFRARWSDEIHDEWIRNLLQNRPDLTAAQLRRTRELMNKAVPDCLVGGYLGIAKSLILPDPDDAHVLAAAICCRAQNSIFHLEKTQVLGTMPLLPVDHQQDSETEGEARKLPGPDHST